MERFYLGAKGEDLACMSFASGALLFNGMKCSKSGVAGLTPPDSLKNQYYCIDR